MGSFSHRERVATPLAEVFAWISRPGALERLTPPWERLEVLERTGGLEIGSRLSLLMRRGPIRIRWELEHTAFEPERRFVDEQRRGPFGAWRHEHGFLADEGGTILEDRVEWRPPRWCPSALFPDWFLRDSLRRLMLFRARRLAGDLELHRRLGGGEGRTVAVTGSTGLIGNSLVHLLTTGGYRVLRLTRAPSPGPGWLQWDPLGGGRSLEGLEGAFAVVHLAGEPIAGGRWTELKRRRIRESRERGTLQLSKALAGLDSPPEVFLSASAVGFYGDRGEEVLTEESGSGEGFLAEVCRRWEEATAPAQNRGIRTVHLRTGVVLSPAGGALPSLLLPFRWGLGGRLGSGEQRVPWIDHDDLLGILLHALRTPGLSGPINGTAPTPVSNATLARTLSRVLRRPALFPVPGAAVRALLGDLGQELLLSGQHALPERALTSGYRFRFDSLEASLRYQLGLTTEVAP